MKVKVGDEEILLDPKNLMVDEVNMNDFLKNFASIYNYYNIRWAKAQYLQYLTEDKFEVICSEKFNFYKENEGGSDKLSEHKVKMNEHVIKARRLTRDAKYVAQLLFTYLRALDKAHENALNLGYNIRKEVDKIFPNTIKGKSEDYRNADEEVAKLFESR